MRRPSCCRPIPGDPTRLRQGGQVPVFAVIYHYTDEHERRDEVRPIHRTFLVGLGEAMLCAGSFAPHEDAGALLLFLASWKEAILALLDEGPFRIPRPDRARRCPVLASVARSRRVAPSYAVNENGLRSYEVVLLPHGETVGHDGDHGALSDENTLQSLATGVGGTARWSSDG